MKTKRIILLAGKINSGKNFVADLAEEYYISEGKTVTQMSFAGPVKDMAANAFNNYTVHLNKTIHDTINVLSELRPNVKVDESVERLRSLVIDSENWYENKTESSRLLIQTLGTGIMRNEVDPSFWIRKAAIAVHEADAEVIIFTDLRFQNEHSDLENLLVEMFGFDTNYEIETVQVVRDADRSNTMIHEHESENDLEDFQFDIIINNEGTKEDTRLLVEATL